jgi:hypothetical protein
MDARPLTMRCFASSLGAHRNTSARMIQWRGFCVPWEPDVIVPGAKEVLSLWKVGRDVDMTPMCNFGLRYKAIEGKEW